METNKFDFYTEEELHWAIFQEEQIEQKHGNEI